MIAFPCPTPDLADRIEVDHPECIGRITADAADKVAAFLLGLADREESEVQTQKG